MAAKNYTINFVDPTKSTLNVLPNAVAGPRGGNRQTDIDLIGMGHSLWGETILENFIHMLENFSSEEDIHIITSVPTGTTFTIVGDVERAFPPTRSFNIWGSTGSPTDDGTYVVQSAVYNGSTETTITLASTGSPLTAPNLTSGAISASAGELGVPNKAGQFSATTPIEGQMWYNQTRGQIYVYEFLGSPLTGIWKRVGGITFSDTAPTAPSISDLWWETSTYAISSDEYERNLRIFTGGSPDWTRVSANYLPRDGSKAMQGALNMDSHKIENLADPDSADDAVNLGYADNRFVNVTGDAMAGDLDMATNQINNVGTPVVGTDGINRDYADGRYVNDTGDTMLGTLAFSAVATLLEQTSTNGKYSIVQDDGSGRVEHLWNATWTGAVHTYAKSGEPAVMLRIHTTGIEIYHAISGTIGATISWIGPTTLDGTNITISGAEVLTAANFETQKTESLQDIVGAMISGNFESGIDVTYDDGANKLNFVVTGGATVTYNGAAYYDSASNLVGNSLEVVFGATTKYIPSSNNTCGCTCTCTCTCTCNCAHSKCAKWG